MLRWFLSDGTTPLTPSGFNLGTVGPGQTYSGLHDGPAHLILRNVPGTGTASGVVVQINSVAAFPGNQYLLVAVGDEPPAPEEFSGYEDPPVEVGTLAEEAEVNVWVDLAVPVYAPRGVNQAVDLFAYGA